MIYVLPEALVIFACVSNNGCTETSNQYFVQNPEVKQYLDEEAQKIRHYVGPRLVDNVGPILFFIAGGQGTVKLGHGFSFQASKQDARLSFRWDF